MAEGGPFGEPRGTGGVLDVDGVVLMQAGRPLGQNFLHAVAGRFHQASHRGVSRKITHSRPSSSSRTSETMAR